MAAEGTITDWIADLQGADSHAAEQAAREIWYRFERPLLNIARRRLGENVRRREDEQDVLQSVFKSFCLRQRRGQFEIAGRDDLWTLLVMLTARKVAATLRRHGRQRRDFRCEQHAVDESGHAGRGDERPIAGLQGREIAADDWVMLNEEFECRLAMLPDELRRVAVWRLAGYTAEEISAPDRLDCAPRTVERKLQRIRRIWEREPSER